MNQLQKCLAKVYDDPEIETAENIDEHLKSKGQFIWETRDGDFNYAYGPPSLVVQVLIDGRSHYVIATRRELPDPNGQYSLDLLNLDEGFELKPGKTTRIIMVVQIICR